jgi:hypothetical protein
LRTATTKFGGGGVAERKGLLTARPAQALVVPRPAWSIRLLTAGASRTWRRL